MRQMLYPVNAPEWSSPTWAEGTGGANYSRYTQIFPAASWQHGAIWETLDDVKQSANYNSYD